MKKRFFMFLFSLMLISLPVFSAYADEFENEMYSSATGYADVGPERLENIRLAAERLDGTVVQPGESFSFNAVCGPYTAENGYSDAPVYYERFPETENVRTVGGGVSQLASNVYRCAMYTAMRLDEHTNHRFRFPSIKMGEDVYVGPEQNEDGSLRENGSVCDFRFTNTSSAPLKISCTVDTVEERIAVSFFSTEPYTDRCFVDTDLTSVYHKLYTNVCIGFLVRPERTVFDRFSNVLTTEMINDDKDGDGHIDYDRYNLFEDQYVLS